MSSGVQKRRGRRPKSMLGELGELSQLRQELADERQRSRELEQANAGLRAQLEQALADIHELCVDAGQAHGREATLAARRQNEMLSRARAIQAARASHPERAS